MLSRQCPPGRREFFDQRWLFVALVFAWAVSPVCLVLLLVAVVAGMLLKVRLCLCSWLLVCCAAGPQGARELCGGTLGAGAVNLEL